MAAPSTLLDLLRRLSAEPRSAGLLAAGLGVDRARIAKALALLATHGLVVRTGTGASEAWQFGNEDRHVDEMLAHAEPFDIDIALDAPL